MGIKQIEGFYQTPPLWKGSQFGIIQFEFPKIDLAHFKAREIPENIRLGHQMEHVFEQLITFEDTYSILLQNEPIRSGKTTIGELDFILKHKHTEELMHVELTYKFYIIDSSISEPIHRLMGPNRKDMFFTKMEKIKNDQFSLIHSAEAQNVLTSHHIDSSQIRQSCCFKAQLFKPFEEQFVHIRPLNLNCIVGYWMRFEDFEKNNFRDYLFYIPFKKEWPIEPHKQVSWISFTETLMEVNLRMIRKNAPMLWMHKPSGELEKFFVVWW
ncbi:MAG: DUF1853 family protein [Bacteroidota bacterium]